MQVHAMHIPELVSLFKQTIRYRNSTADMARLGPWLQHQLSKTHFPNLSHLPFEPRAYTRNCIAKEDVSYPQGTLTEAATAQYEALIMRWDQQVKTSIHGHPKFSFYYVISGLFEIEFFELTVGRKLNLKAVQRRGATEASWFLGQAHCYDNCIHRVTCLRPGFTFHIYSEDARKGRVYD